MRITVRTFRIDEFHQKSAESREHTRHLGRICLLTQVCLIPNLGYINALKPRRKPSPLRRARQSQPDRLPARIDANAYRSRSVCARWISVRVPGHHDADTPRGAGTSFAQLGLELKIPRRHVF